MKAIWKYELMDDSGWTNKKLVLPESAKILCVKNQKKEEKNTITLWVLIDQDYLKNQEHVFEILGTGHPFTAQKDYVYSYVGTCIWENKGLVWHVFEEEKK